jgi:hypothetical protein
MGLARSIVKIIPYFGRWPEWINFYIESCKANDTIDWIFYTDCSAPSNRAANVTFRHMSFEAYKSMVSAKLGIDFNPSNPYKLCDLKPVLGYLHQDDIAAYDYYAFGDIDIIYGDIRGHITDELIERYEMITTHDTWVAGHFTLFRNNRKMRGAFRKICGWRSILQKPEYCGLDERGLTDLFLGNRWKRKQTLRRRLKRFLNPYQRNALFHESHSTILAPRPWHNGRMEHPQVWYWKDGRLTNEQDGDREFLYLHFMNWKSNRYLFPLEDDTPSAWMKLDTIVHMDQSDLSRGFRITAQGFHELIS